MLQWMGGSRRKIATSRKSTQKRQKQYFEQRKRLQQQQNCSGFDNNSNGMNVYGQPQRENRSLDILSLLILSAAGEDHKTGCPCGGELLDSNDQKGSKLFIDHPSIKISNTEAQVMPVEIQEAGLGKVEAETPLHSPQQTDRIFPNDFPSPLKHRGHLDMLENQHHVVNDIELKVKSIMESMDVPCQWHSFGCSIDAVDWYGSPEVNSCTRDRLKLHFNHDRTVMPSSHKYFFDEVDDIGKDIWEASSSSLDDKCFPGGRDYNVLWKKHPFEVDDLFDDLTRYKNHEFSAHDSRLKKRGIAEAGGRGNTSVYPPYFEQHGSDEALWSGTVVENPRESSSLQSFGSEESCSSAAAGGNMINNSHVCTKVKNNSKKYVNTYCQQGLNAHESRCQTSASIFPKEQLVHHSDAHMLDKMGSKYSWSCKKGHSLMHANTDSSSFSGNSERKSEGSGIRIWRDEPLNVSPVIEFPTDAQYPLDSSKHRGSFSSHSCSDMLKGSELGKFNSCDLPYFPDIDVVLTMGESHILHMKDMPSNFLNVVDPYNEILVQESFGADEGVSEFQTNHYQKIDFEARFCKGYDGLDTENGESDNDVIYEASEKVEGGTSAVIESMSEAHHVNHSEDTIAAATAEELKSSDRKKSLSSAGLGMPFHIERTEGKLDEKASRKVLMLESCVVQLSCVQKILKEPTVQSFMKEV